jgi:hypothetical protein
MQNSGAEIESVENNAKKLTLKMSYAENFCNRNKSQKLHFSVIFLLRTFLRYFFETFISNLKSA